MKYTIRINSKGFYVKQITIQRLKEYLDVKGILPSAFERSCKMSNGSFAKQYYSKGSVSSNLLEKIAVVYPDLNMTWLITGNGYMITKTQKSSRQDELATQKLEEEHATYKTKNKAAELIQEGLDLLNSTLKKGKRK